MKIRELGRTYVIPFCQERTSNDNLIKFFFKQYINYIYRFIDPNTITQNQLKKERNYIIYHYCKYIYHNVGVNECLDNLQKERYKELLRTMFIDTINMTFDFSIPEDEPKKSVLWLSDCVKKLDNRCKLDFVSKLSPDILDFLLRHKRLGLTTMVRKRKKELTKSTALQK